MRVRARLPRAWLTGALIENEQDAETMGISIFEAYDSSTTGKKLFQLLSILYVTIVLYFLVLGAITLKLELNPSVGKRLEKLCDCLNESNFQDWRTKLWVHSYRFHDEAEVGWIF